MLSLMEACQKQKVCVASEWMWIWTGSSEPDAFSVCKHDQLQCTLLGFPRWYYVVMYWCWAVFLFYSCRLFHFLHVMILYFLNLKFHTQMWKLLMLWRLVVSQVISIVWRVMCDVWHVVCALLCTMCYMMLMCETAASQYYLYLCYYFITH